MVEGRADPPRIAIAFALLALLVGVWLGQSYISRLPNHAGYFLVPVVDRPEVPPPDRPRHTLVIVVDGLRRDAAESMAVTRALLAYGQCRISDQGSWTVSRPVYALLSTGLEVDRSGARNNEQTAPLAAESIWEVARGSGLVVHGRSHLPWFRQLFPGGFDRFDAVVDHRVDLFEDAGLTDLDLVHPLYVDEAGHREGAASDAYASAVRRADREISALLTKIDFTKDLVVVTADHGHRAEGGHGGAAPELKDVLVCFAGKNVARRVDRGRFDGRVTAPALAVMLGLPFPRHMRAVEDGLDTIFEVADFGPAGGPWVEDRQSAVARFRDENARALERLGVGPTWTSLESRERGHQQQRLVLAALVGGALLAVRLAARRRRGDALVTSLLFLATSFVLLVVAHALVLGAFDFTVINLKERYVPRAFGAVVLALGLGEALFAVAGRVGVRANPPGVDAVTLLGILVFLNVVHVLVYGWPLGYPLPGAAARYLPFFGAFVVLGTALLVFGRSLLQIRRGAR